jgi:hypothetical protein
MVSLLAKSSCGSWAAVTPSPIRYEALQRALLGVNQLEPAPALECGAVSEVSRFLLVPASSSVAVVSHNGLQ